MTEYSKLSDFDLKNALQPGIILVEGVEARARAQEIYYRFTPHMDRTVAMIEPGPDNRLGATVEELAKKGTVLVIAHPLWPQITMWEWADRSRTVLHASHGQVTVVRHD